MAITKRTITANRGMANRTSSPARSARMISAGRGLTSNVRDTRSFQKPVNSAMQKIVASFNPEQMKMLRQLEQNCRSRRSITAATNTSNIPARPDFLELLPIFVQKLLITDVYGSVVMKSRQQLIPYFKVVAENTKGETLKGDVLSSPFVNRQGVDPNFTGRVVKNETIATATTTANQAITLGYGPVLPGSVTVSTNLAGVTTPYTDGGDGFLYNAAGAAAGNVEYATRTVSLTAAQTLATGDSITATYQYDNETVGPDANGNYGAMMGKFYLDLDEINLIAQAHELSSYWSIYSAFATSQEYGADLETMSKEAAISQLTAEINSNGFRKLEAAAAYKPQFNFDASPVYNGSVVPSDYLQMFKLKLQQASASIYTATQLAKPNRLVVGTNAATIFSMFPELKADNVTDTTGPYHLGALNEFEIYVDPNFADPNKWVMSCKSNDIRRNTGLFGEYMPIVETSPIGLANASVQQGYATMYAAEVINKATACSGKILGLN
jgi:hypothetical protein